MKPEQLLGPDYAARIRRAQDFAAAKPFAAEILRFYQQVAEFQNHLLNQFGTAAGSCGTVLSASCSPGEFLVNLPLEHFAAFLALVERSAPPPLAEAARLLAQQDTAAWSRLLTAFLLKRSSNDAPSDLLDAFFPRAFLQPWAEFVAAHTVPPHLDATPRLCPLCSGRPLLGVLRPEGDGGRRSLVCSFCGYEWSFRRILCPACGEEEEAKLPVYVAEELPHIRVEACDRCQHYLRTVDLTKDGNAVPLVDDLAAIPLSLWAHEHGYNRLQSNLLGT